MAKQRNKFNVDEQLEQSFNIKQLGRALVYIKRHSKSLTIGFILCCVSILLDLLTPIFTEQIVDNAIPSRNISLALIIGFLYLADIVTMLIVDRGHALIFNRVSQTMITEIRHDMFVHLQKLPFDYFDSRPHGKILTRVVNYVNSVASFLSNGIISTLLQVVKLVAILFFMFRMHARLTLVVLIGVPLFAALMVVLKTPQRRAYQKLSNKGSNLNAYLQESISGIKVTQAFNREEINYGIFEELCEDYRKAWMRAIKISRTIESSVIFLSVVFVAIIYYAVAAKWFGEISVGVMLAFVGYANRFWGPIQSLGNLYNQLITNMAYLERIFEFLDEPISIDDKENAYPLPEIAGKVEFDHVQFHYEEGTPVLTDMHFTAEAGESIALVGPTGCGKSTVISLLARFYDIKGGQILIDGNPIGDVTLASLRSQMGMMLQESFLFTGTIMENIRYGRLDATDEEVIAAAKAVHADDFISKFPDGYETEVRERGSSLSAGQRQLVSFARTLLADPRILILDEATSAMDSQTEQLVQEGLNALLKGRTSFIIAHRLSTIKNCRILYLKDGVVAESGTHNELLAKKGLYYDLYTAQIG
ncbi:MAG: ABC transporter ATP-binding protein [Ruminococcaceae bacterium]|nr:ABC transporter ATP-binding protein [Oscillospiraceae bacterium]